MFLFDMSLFWSVLWWSMIRWSFVCDSSVDWIHDFVLYHIANAILFWIIISPNDFAVNSFSCIVVFFCLEVLSLDINISLYSDFDEKKLEEHILNYDTKRSERSKILQILQSLNVLIFFLNQLLSKCAYVAFLISFLITDYQIIYILNLFESM